MARRSSASRSKSKSSRTARAGAEQSEHLALNWEVWGLVLMALGLVTFISLASRSQGRLTAAWALFLRRIFGLGAFPVALLIIGVGTVLLLRQALQTLHLPGWQTLVGWELLFFAGLGLIHITASGSYWELAREGKRGGYVGWALAHTFVSLLGKPLGVLLLIGIMLGGGYLGLGVPWPLIVWRGRWLWAQLGMRLRRLIAMRPERIAHRTSTPAQAPSTTPARTGAPRSKVAPSPPPHTVKPRSRSRAPKPSAARATATRAYRTAPGLPSLDLLTPDQAGSEDDADARHRAQIIEETLDAFGIPAEVVEWHRGPVVTQFGVEPGFIERQDREGNTRRFKIRVSKILSLSNDLALALAAAPIRIEAPVPGRAVVGIEVPNSEKTLVGLHGVLASPDFQKLRSRLKFALGRDVSGGPVVTDLDKMPHLLIAGATGSGKSVCLNAIIVSLLMTNTPDQLKLLLIDPKRVELTKYNGTPHLVAPVVVDAEKVILSLRWVMQEMDRRYGTFAEHGARNLAAYNRLAKRKGLEPLPLIVVIVDELADLMLTSGEDVERTVCRLAQMARATGIHLVISTQRPSVDVVTGLIKANFPARISFAVTSQVDSRVILDAPGAENLLGRGDMLFMTPASAKLQRIQGCFVSDSEIDAVVAFWRNQAPADWESIAEAPPWEDMSLAQDDTDDGMLQKAIDLVRQHEHASASFLQRHLHIGYPRAGRLIDQLEEMGIVGPPETGGRSREVLDLGPDADQEAKKSAGGD
ncbi:MAG: DUF87 domain-containing protein [Anaerolineae bacterium]|nr:DUF87 domain-containing protein [Anaerolineae bacterium]